MSKNDLADDIIRELKAYSDALAVEVDNISKRNARKLMKKIKETSPELTGDYKEGWRVKQVTDKLGASKFVVHNATDYQLTHLLEDGHAIAGGTGRVDAIPHIVPAEEEIAPKYMAEIEKAVQKNGS